MTLGLLCTVLAMALFVVSIVSYVLYRKSDYYYTQPTSRTRQGGNAYTHYRMTASRLSRHRGVVHVANSDPYETVLIKGERYWLSPDGAMFCARTGQCVGDFRRVLDLESIRLIGDAS